MDLIEQTMAVSLDGSWQFSLGLEGPWGEIQTPGCWEAQGYSKLIDGPAFYRHSLHIPSEWAGRQVAVEFDAVSYACTIKLDGREIGQHIGLWTPFSLNITHLVRPGEDHLLELEVWKPGERYPMRSSLAGFLPDVATTFGGIWQACRLRAYSWTLKDVVVQADYASRSIRIKAQVDPLELLSQNNSWLVEISQNGQPVLERQLSVESGAIDLVIPIADALLWSPEDPLLYTVRLFLLNGGQTAAHTIRRVGFRRLSAAGSQLMLNDQPFMVRGILSWGWVPERIAPTYTIAQAREEIRQVRRMGFNLIKLCLVIPGPEYFAAADEEGMLLWAELPMWLPEVTDAMRLQAPLEYAEIAAMLAGHPSITLYSLGCELNKAVDSELIEQLNAAVRSRVADVLLCDNSGSGESYGGLDFDFSDFTDYHPYYDLHYFEPLLDNWRRDWQVPRPWIFGEFCDSDTFRDLTEIIQANHGSRPWWLTKDNPVTIWRNEAKAVLEWEERLAAAQPGLTVKEIIQASLRQSYIIRKYTLEALRRRRGMGGYIVTGLRDTPISTSGVWDDFGRPKWSGEAYAQINGEAILALDVVRRRQWRFGGDRPDRVDPYNFWSAERASWSIILSDTGQGFPAGSNLVWSLSDLGGQILASGASQLGDSAQPGGPVQVGIVHVTMPQVERPVELCLEARLLSGEREAHNTWPVWVHSKPTVSTEKLVFYDPSGIFVDHTGLSTENGDWFSRLKYVQHLELTEKTLAVVTAVLDQPVLEYLTNGGRVLLLQQGESPLPVRRCPFWRESVNLFAQHDLWEHFPQRGFTSLQFFGLASDLAFDTSRLSAALPSGALIHPILRRLDAREFHVAEYLFEAAVGQGLLIGCSLRLQGGAGSQPFGWNRNVAGGSMLNALLNLLSRAA